VRVTQVCVVLVGIALLVGALGTPFALVAAPLLLGLGVGIETPASSDILARVTATEHRPFVFSLKQTGVQSGGMVAGVLYPAILPLVGWRGAMAWMGATCIAYALVLEPLRRRTDREARSAVGAKPPHGNVLKLVLREPRLRRFVGAAFTFHAMQVCVNTFLVSFLVTQHGLALTTAGALLTAAQFGGFAGRLGTPFVVGPRLSVARLLVVMGVGMSLCGLAVGLGAGHMPGWLLAVMCGLFGLTSSGWNGVFLAEVARLAGDQIARVTGGVLVIAYAGLILGPLAFTAVAAGVTLGAGFAVMGIATLAGSLMLAPRRQARAAPPV